MNIVTEFWLKPIPCRDHDWQATTSEYDGPGSPIGSGRTEREAVENLLDQLPEAQAEALRGWYEQAGE